ncbi:MAG: hypothetical protein N2448_08350 [Caloramator sp.]|nr:hypothetical protein [Caloramator sp.]
MTEKHNKKKILKKSEKILLLLSILFLCCLVLYTTYYFIKNKSKSVYINTLYKQKLIIDSVNKESTEVLKNIDNLDINDTSKLNEIISVLSKSENTLQNVINNLSQVSPPQKFKVQFDNLFQGVSLNKKIYTQTLLILKNTKSNNLMSASINLENYIQQTYQHYENAKLDKISILLPSDILVLSDKIYQYASKVYSNHEAKTRLLEQYNNYFYSMDKIISDYQNAKTNLNDELKQIRNGKVTIENIYIKIENKLSFLDSISISYNTLSVPVKVAEQHQKFNNLITMYTNYCLDFKSSLYKLEEATKDEVTLMEINMQLENLNNQYNKINDSFFEFLDKYNEIKSFYTDINNL